MNALYCNHLLIIVMLCKMCGGVRNAYESTHEVYVQLYNIIAFEVWGPRPLRALGGGAARPALPPNYTPDRGGL